MHTYTSPPKSFSPYTNPKALLRLHILSLYMSPKSDCDLLKIHVFSIDATFHNWVSDVCCTFEIKRQEGF